MASQQISVPRPSLRRAAAILLVIASVFAPGLVEAKGAAVPRAYAGIVVDAKSGKVLYESAADAFRYPASVTKVMTLYILFQELSAGHVKLSDKFTVSKHAAAASPTKLGLKAGSTITVENAIKSIVTISANDMARVIAENISGSEADFAQRMTATAKALGMRHTVYYNASGLPDARQITTVRDQSVLGIAIYEHFPKFYEFFQTKSFSYGKRTYGNHNNLLGSNGIDGIKTGYTGAAGYNLLTAARKDGRHIVVAGFGFDSSRKRDAKVRELVKSYLPEARSGAYLKTAMIPLPGRKGSPIQQPDEIRVAVAGPVVPMPAPAFRTTDDQDEDANPEFGVGDVDDDVTVAVISAAPPRPLAIEPAVEATKAVSGTAKRKSIPEVVGNFTESYSLGAAPAPLGQTSPSAPLIPPVGVGEGGEAIDLLTSGSIPEAANASPGTRLSAIQQVATAEQAIPAKLPSGWIVQIGAAPTETGASGLLDKASGKIGALGQFQSFVQRFEKDGQTFYRARFGGFAGQSAANDMCKQLKKAKLSCLAMQS